TPGLRRADDSFAAMARAAGLKCEVVNVNVGRSGGLRRQSTITDYVEARAARNVASGVKAGVVVYSTVTAALLPKPRGPYVRPIRRPLPPPSRGESAGRFGRLVAAAGGEGARRRAPPPAVGFRRARSHPGGGEGRPRDPTSRARRGRAALEPFGHDRRGRRAR